MTFLVFGVALVAATAAQAQAIASDADTKEIVILPAPWIGPVSAALADFKQTHSNWACFDTVIIPEADTLRIGFGSKPVTTEDPTTGSISIGPQTRCGPGSEYIVGMDGEILKRTSR